jgi:hypothetical protein
MLLSTFGGSRNTSRSDIQHGTEWKNCIPNLVLKPTEDMLCATMPVILRLVRLSPYNAQIVARHYLVSSRFDSQLSLGRLAAGFLRLLCSDLSL